MYYITQECSQKWYRLRCWKRHPSENLFHFRRFLHGFAIGPIMFIHGKRPK